MGSTRITTNVKALKRAAQLIAAKSAKDTPLSPNQVLNTLAAAIAGNGKNWGFLSNTPFGHYVQPGLGGDHAEKGQEWLLSLYAGYHPEITPVCHIPYATREAAMGAVQGICETVGIRDVDLTHLGESGVVYFEKERGHYELHITKMRKPEQGLEGIFDAGRLWEEDAPEFKREENPFVHAMADMKSGTDEDAGDIITKLMKSGTNLIIAGPAASGKTSMITRLMEEPAGRTTVSAFGFPLSLRYSDADVHSEVSIEGISLSVQSYPEIVIVDEIQTKRELLAASEVAGQGCQVIAAMSFEDRKAAARGIYPSGFNNIIWMDKVNGRVRFELNYMAVDPLIGPYLVPEIY